MIVLIVNFNVAVCVSYASTIVLKLNLFSLIIQNFSQSW